MSDPVSSIPIPGLFERRSGFSFTGEYPNLTIRSRAGIREFCLVIPVVLLSVAGVLIETATIYNEGVKALTGRDIGSILLVILIALLLPFGVRAQTLEFSPTGLRVRSRLPWSQPGSTTGESLQTSVSTPSATSGTSSDSWISLNMQASTTTLVSTSRSRRLRTF